eukprot:Amastigsp_a340061_23.p1 type:complete len:498 gc:universal Amastigsp_a340061_23:1-1494(+)
MGICLQFLPAFSRGLGPPMNTVGTVSRSRTTTTPPSYLWTVPIIFLYTATILCSGTAVSLYVITRVCDDLNGGVRCDSHAVSTLSAKWSLAITLTQSLPAVLVAGTLGVLSDARGRRLTLVPPCLATSASTLIVFATAWYRLPLSGLLVAGVVSGLGGGSATLFLGCFSYVADVTHAIHRSISFAVVESMLYAGVVAGQFLAGPLIAAVGYASVFAGTATLSLVVSYLALNMPESLAVNAAARSQPIPWSQANIFAALRILGEPCLWGSKWVLLSLAVAFTMAYSALQAWSAIAILYTKLRFDWSPVQVSVFFGVNWSVRTIVVLFVAPLLFETDFFAKPGSKLRLMLRVVLAAFVLETGEYLVFAYGTGRLMYLGAVMDGVSALAFPIMRSQFSLAAKKDRQGASLAVISACETFANLVAPTLLTAVYAETNSQCILCSFYILVGMMAIGACAVGVMWAAVLRYAAHIGIASLDELLAAQEDVVVVATEDSPLLFS